MLRRLERMRLVRARSTVAEGIGRRIAGLAAFWSDTMKGVVGVLHATEREKEAAARSRELPVRAGRRTRRSGENLPTDFSLFVVRAILVRRDNDEILF